MYFRQTASRIIWKVDKFDQNRAEFRETSGRTFYGGAQMVTYAGVCTCFLTGLHTHTHTHTHTRTSFWVWSCVGVWAGISPYGFQREELTHCQVLFFFPQQGEHSVLFCRSRGSPLFSGTDTPSMSSAHIFTARPVLTLQVTVTCGRAMRMSFRK